MSSIPVGEHSDYSVSSPYVVLLDKMVHQILMEMLPEKVGGCVNSGLQPTPCRPNVCDGASSQEPSRPERM